MSTPKDLPEAREICPTTAQRLLKEGALLVDVREAADVARLGFAGCDVLTIPLSEFEARWAEVPRERAVILADEVPDRSLKATYFLLYQDYTQVMNMQYGLGRWVARGFPITGSAEALGATQGCCGGTAGCC